MFFSQPRCKHVFKSLSLVSFPVSPLLSIVLSPIRMFEDPLPTRLEVTPKRLCTCRAALAKGSGLTRHKFDSQSISHGLERTGPESITANRAVTFLSEFRVAAAPKTICE